MPNAPSSPSNHPLAKGTVILDAEHCPQCGYNLQGLHRGGVCPECGRGITTAARGVRSRMIEAPRGYLARLAATFLMMGWAAFAAFIGALVPAIITSLPVVRALYVAESVRTIALIVAFLAAVVWALGVLAICVRRPGFSAQNPEQRQWARLAQCTQPLWPAALALLAVATVMDIEALYIPAYIAAFVAGLGMVPTTMQIAEYPDWGDDLNLGIKVRTAGWMIGAGVVVDGLLRLTLAAHMAASIIITIIWVFTTLIATGGLLLLALQCLQVASVARWAIINSKDAEERDARLAEKAAQEQRERDARIAAQERAAAIAPPEPPPPYLPRHASTEKVIDATDEAPYELEDP